MEMDDFEETCLELWNLQADLILGKVTPCRRELVRRRLVFLDWCLWEMKKRARANGFEVLLLKGEYVKLRSGYSGTV